MNAGQNVSKLGSKATFRFEKRYYIQCVKHMHKTSFKNWSTNSPDLEVIQIFAQYSIQIVAVWSKSFFFGESQKVSAFCHFSLQPLVSSFLFKSIIYPFTSTWFQQEIFIFHIQADVTCKILLNQPHGKLGQHCTARCSILTMHDTRRRACLVLLCAMLTPLNKDETLPLIQSDSPA